MSNCFLPNGVAHNAVGVSECFSVVSSPVMPLLLLQTVELHDTNSSNLCTLDVMRANGGSRENVLIREVFSSDHEEIIENIDTNIY